MMATPMANHGHKQLPAILAQMPNPLTKEYLSRIVTHVNMLRQQGYTPENNKELEEVCKFLQQYGAMQRQNTGLNGHVSQVPMTNGIASKQLPFSPSSGPPPTQPIPPPSVSPISFTSDEIAALRAQILAFKFLARGLPVPDHLHHAIRLPTSAGPDYETLLQGQDVNARIVDSAVKLHKGVAPVPDGAFADGTAQDSLKAEEVDQSGDLAPLSSEDANSGIYPYNAFHHPFSYLKRATDADPAQFATRLQRLIVPTVMPAGLDVHQIFNERERFIEARMQQRIRELEALPSTLGDGGFETAVDELKKETEDDSSQDPLNKFPVIPHPSPSAHGKLRAIIELKSLRVVEKQRALRAMVSERLIHGALIPINRADFRRTRRPTIRDARHTEQLERKQRADRERRAKHKHIAQLNVICDHGRNVIAVNRAAQDRVVRLNRQVLAFHANTEKEEQKRVEKIAKDRLKALKADDEEAYMKLIDTAKDHRITHLLRETDTYLDSLAQAVVAQQNESGPMEQIHFETEAGPASEATFGAKVNPEDVAENKGRVDYYAIAHRISEKITKQPDLLVGGTLKEYQIKGLQWMVSLYNNRLNGILADEMGLGKTIQTISLVTFLIESKRQRGPYLVIVPLSTMTNWSGEFSKWAPKVGVIAYKGNPAQRRDLQAEIRMGQFQVLLTTYEYIIKDRPILSKLKWVHMIIDEGHRMKNTGSKLSQTLTTYYHSRHRLILTGTPLQNNLPELWSLLNFVLPKIFNSVKSFDEWFNTPFANAGGSDKIELNEEEALLIIRRLHKVLRPFLLRRLKKDVESELPDKVEKVIKVRMSALQSQLYKQMKKHKMIASGRDDVKGKTSGIKGLSNELMQLRKICQHPFLFDSVEDKMAPGGFVDDMITRTAGKFELLQRILPKFFMTGHRILIFFQMTKVMDIMEDFLKWKNWKYLRLDGGTKTEERASHVQLFNAPQSDYKVFILSTRAGGLGLNLQTADTVIIFDSDWNPHADLQAQDRAHRIGQTKAVLILRFITEKSVEEAMYSRARYKLDIDDKVIQAGRFDNKSTQEEQEELLRSILEADQEEENEESGDMNDEELNLILARSDEEQVVFRELDTKRERDAVDAWRAEGKRGKPPPALIQLEELPECYKSDEPFEMKEVDEIIEGRGQRKRNTVIYNDGLDDDAWAQALEEGEDLTEITERARDQKVKRGPTTKLIKDAETSNRGTPISEDGRGRRGRPPKRNKIAMPEFETPVGAKRKRGGLKSISVTPSINNDEDDEERDQKRRKTKAPEMTTAARDKMKKAFNECLKAVTACEDEHGRKRCELFRDLPDRRDYPDYYQLITQPIAISTLRKRINGNMYKTVQAFREDWRLMFKNARTYNQEGSWVYVDANEMEKVFNATYDRVIPSLGLPGATSIGVVEGSASGSYESALTPTEEDERPHPARGRGSGRKQVVSEDEYLTSDDDP